MTAVARDAAGNTTTAAAVTVTVNNDLTAPTVAITAPSAAATVSGSTTVSADAADNIGVVGVQFKLDGANLGTEVTAAPYQVAWNTALVANGAHALTAIARDVAGNTTTSAAITVTVNNADVTSPTVAMTAPAAGATIVGTVAVSATASDNIGVVGVQFRLDGVNLGAEDTAAPYTINWDSKTAANGTRLLTAIARDAAGNTTTSAVVSVTVNNDLTAPTVSMTAPLAGATVSGAAVAVSATAADNVAVVGVQFLLDGVALGAEDTAAPYSVTWNTVTATNGAHTLSARARDAAANTTTSATVAVTVSNTAAPAGLVLALNFDEATGTQALDRSGLATPNNGTMNVGVTRVAGRSAAAGSAADFNGVNGIVTVNDAASLDLTTAVTMSAWVRFDGGGQLAIPILKERGVGLLYSLYSNDPDVSRPAGFLFVGGSDRLVTGTAALAVNTWTHIAVTYGGGFMRFFVNGVQVSQVAQTGNMTASNNPLRLGGNTIWGEYFTGQMDDVRIYNRVLTAAEIQTDMNTTVK